MNATVMTRWRTGGAALALSLVVSACAATPGVSSPATSPLGTPAATNAQVTPTPGVSPVSEWHLVTDQAPFTGATLTGIVAGGPGLVAIGAVQPPAGEPVAALFVSPAGLSWSQLAVPLGFTSWLAWPGSLAAGPSGVVAIGSVRDAETGAWRASPWLSTDGREWRPADPQPGFGGIIVTGASTTPEGFVAVGCRATETVCLGLAVLLSHDGLAWTRIPDVPGAKGLPEGVVAGASGLVAWGNDCVDVCGEVHGLLWTSTDGTDWAVVPSAPELEEAAFGAVAAWSGGFVAVGSEGHRDEQTGESSSSAAAWASPDGRSWTRVQDADAFEGASLTGVLASGSILVAVGSTVDGDFARAAMWTSADGLTWRRAPDTDAFDRGTMTGAAVGPAGLVAIGSVGTAEVSRPAVWVGPLPAAP